MTRCIHCTRCVRFFEEVAGAPFLGTMGRGKDTEISTYVSLGMLHSNISGNVIDLCPVGALTSKPHAFLYRPWELTSIETVDTTDALASNIRVDLKGAEIVRVLPKRNDLINEDWISDATRYGYEGLKKNRLSVPMLRNSFTGEFISSGWASFYEAFALHYSVDSSSISVILGPSLDLFTVYVSQFFSKLYSSASFNSNVSSVHTTDFRNLFTLQPSISSLESSDLLVFLHVNLSKDFPVLQARLKKNNASILHCGVNTAISLEHRHVGLSSFSYFSLYRGKSAWSSLVCGAKRPHFISNGSISLPTNSFISGINTFSFSTLISNLTTIHAAETGVLASVAPSVPSVYYAVDAVDIVPDTSDSVFSVYQGTNAHTVKTKGLAFTHNSWYVPACSAFESRGFYLNILGYLQLTRKCTSRIGLSMSHSDILLNLFIRLSKLHFFYKNINVLSSSVFYSYFLDNIVVYASELSTYKLTSSFKVSTSGSFAVLADVSPTNMGVSHNSPYHITYSPTLSSVSSLRDISVF